jgi:hypothetical protein
LNTMYPNQTFSWKLEQCIINFKDLYKLAKTLVQNEKALPEISDWTNINNLNALVKIIGHRRAARLDSEQLHKVFSTNSGNLYDWSSLHEIFGLKYLPDLASLAKEFNNTDTKLPKDYFILIDEFYANQADK